jgi:glucan phosphoethanolaminetransferase (alkaline phosphatase superfamily)
VSEPAAEPSRSESRQRLYDWIKTVVIILVAGPPIGGLVFGLLLSLGTVFNAQDKWESIPVTVMISIALSYVIGLPVAAVAIALFLILSRFMSHRTSYLAVLCGVISTAVLIVLNEMMRGTIPSALRLTWPDLVLQVVAFGIPSAVAGWVCWRMTRPLHRMS